MKLAKRLKNGIAKKPKKHTIVAFPACMKARFMQKAKANGCPGQLAPLGRLTFLFFCANLYHVFGLPQKLVLMDDAK